MDSAVGVNLAAGLFVYWEDAKDEAAEGWVVAMMMNWMI